jgi:hypothetical protein
MKGVPPCLVRWACCAGTVDFCPVLAALVSPVQNIMFLTAHFFTLLVPSPMQNPVQTVVLGRLSLCLWFQQSAGAHPSLVSLNLTNYAKTFLALLKVQRFRLPFRNLIYLIRLLLECYLPAIRSHRT